MMRHLLRKKINKIYKIVVLVIQQLYKNISSIMYVRLEMLEKYRYIEIIYINILFIKYFRFKNEKKILEN